MSSTQRQRRETRARELDLRLALLLAGLAATVILALFVVLDPAQEPQPAPVVVPTDATEPIDVPPVDARLVSNVTAVRPGSPFTVGVLIRLQPGWFVFWKDPGDAGLPTNVDFSAPAGFTVAELRWPTPTQFLQPGTLLGYGYGEEVLLTARVDPPTDLSGTTQVPVRAHVTWLTCERVCVPGEANLETSLPVADTALPDNLELVTTWARRLPAPIAENDQIAFDVTSKAALEGGVRFHVRLEWPFEPSDVQWFPVQDAAFRMSEQVTRARDRHTEIEFLLQVAELPEGLPDALESVLAYTDATGVRRGLELRVPLDALLSDRVP